MPLQENRRTSIWSLVCATTGVTILCFTFVLLKVGFSEESVRMNIRWSARFSIICFCLAFSASSVYALVPNALSRWVVKRRRGLGVSFAVIHLIHLLFLVLLHYCFYPLFVPHSLFALTLGGLAYLFIVLMLFTSFAPFSKLISRSNWHRLHALGGYWILIVFSNSILGRIADGKFEYLPLGMLVLAVWGIRILAFRKKKALASSSLYF